MYNIYAYTYILFNHKKEWNDVFCSHMNWSREYHTKWNKSDRERQVLYVECKKKNTNEFIYRIETDCRPGEQIYSYQGEVGEGYIRSTGLTKNKLHVTPQSYKS